MTVITVSTVGFGEVRELSEEGMLFTSILIMGSLGTFAYSISALTTYFVNGEYRTTFKEARLKQEVEKLSNHVIVCGTGRVGEMAVKAADHNTPVVIVENDVEKADSLSAEGHIVISGDATRDENLASAGITKAKVSSPPCPATPRTSMWCWRRARWRPTFTSCLVHRS